MITTHLDTLFGVGWRSDGMISGFSTIYVLIGDRLYARDNQFVFPSFFFTHTMPTDSLSEFKQLQREMWSSFAPSAIFTTPVASNLVAFAGIRAGQHVLDVGTGTGVAAITAARVGAEVCALDLTPELLEQAKQDAAIADQPGIQWIEGDAENLPYPDNSFDVVISNWKSSFFLEI